jgi:hypothetical protein
LSLSQPLATLAASVQPIHHPGIDLIDVDGHMFGAAAIRVVNAHQIVTASPQV